MTKNIDFNYVADLYDYYVNVDFDVAFYKDFCKNYKNILELMCGTGRVSLPLIRAGYSLTCVDYSEDMLRVFRGKLNASDNVTIICQDVCNLALGKTYDLIMIPFNSIAEITDADMRQQAIHAIYDHLAPGGTFFCTLYNPAYRIKSADGNMKPLGKFQLNDGKTMIVTYYNTHSEKDKLISGTQFYEIYDKQNHMIEKRFLDIRFSVISKQEMLSMADEIGLFLKEIYGDYQRTPFTDESPFMNFVFETRRGHAE